MYFFDYKTEFNQTVLVTGKIQKELFGSQKLNDFVNNQPFKAVT